MTDRARHADFFAAADTALARLVARSHGAELAAVTRARTALADLAKVLDPSALAPLIRALQGPRKRRGKPFESTLSADQVRAAMQAAGHNATAAARALGCGRSTIYWHLARISNATASDALQAIPQARKRVHGS